MTQDGGRLSWEFYPLNKRRERQTKYKQIVFKLKTDEFVVEEEALRSFTETD